MILIAYAKHLFSRAIDDQDGASLVEYALLITLIAAVAFIAVASLGTTLSGQYGEIASEIP
jgi:pilus assembly protein Flp/PilA